MTWVLRETREVGDAVTEAQGSLILYEEPDDPRSCVEICQIPAHVLDDIRWWADRSGRSVFREMLVRLAQSGEARQDTPAAGARADDREREPDDGAPPPPPRSHGNARAGNTFQRGDWPNDSPGPWVL